MTNGAQAAMLGHPLHAAANMRTSAGIALTVLAVAFSIAPRAPREDVDLLLRGGTVLDGTGAPARVTDVAVRGDRIVFIGDAAKSALTPKRTIDVHGLVIAPGFIDPHTHTQADLGSPDAGRRANLPYLMQGVTTIITNNDGGGDVNVGAVLDAWTKNGIGTNAALFVPQGSVRNAVLGMSDAAPTADQLDAMRSLVRHGMDAGAIGMSTGLYYAPGSYAKTEEVIELAKIAARAGGIYDTHLRDESSYTIGLIGAVNEAIRIGREAKIPIHISHIKALGTDVWGQSDSVIALIRKARADGIEVTAGQYPYEASGTSVGASLLPRWAEVGGRDSLRARIVDPATRARLTREMETNLRRRGGAASLLISNTRDTTILGRTLEQIAAARHESPIDAALQIVQQGDASVASFNMSEKDIEKFMVQDFIMTDSDGSDGHPRKYGTYPRLLREYVFNKHVLTLPQAIHRSSALPAATLRLPQRGVLAVGNFADVIAFDSTTVADRSTYREPRLLATGMRYVLVNGTVVIDQGNYTGAMAGRALRHTSH
jgi:N-acyl-D-aspartate/D-glutamate deacylase